MRIPRKPRRKAAPAPVVDDADSALFREAIGEVRELQPMPAAPVAPKPEARPAQREADEQSALRESRVAPFAVQAGDLLQYRRPEVAPRVLERLRRGLYAIQDEIDLHRLTAAEAERLLRRFLREARAEGRYCVRVIHGKGLHSGLHWGMHSGIPDTPVLKSLVERLLGQRRDVLAYASAPAPLGGAGAVLVLLARRRAGEASLSAANADAED